MNKETHKTIRILATMENDLYLDINVPIGTGEIDVWEFIRDGNIDGEDMTQYDGYANGSWKWRDPLYGNDFNPDAVDVSEEIAKL